MKCKNCGNEITITDLICPVCKAQVELELGDEFLDDDILKDAIASDIADSMVQNDDTVEEPTTDLQTTADRAADPVIPNKGSVVSFRNLSILLGIVIVILAGVFLYQYFTSDTYYLSKAATADSKGAYEEALELYNKVYAQNPTNTDALKGMAADHMALGEYNEAINCLKEALVINAYDEAGYISLITCYHKTEDTDAIDDLKASAPDSMAYVFEQYVVSAPQIICDDAFYNASNNAYSDDLSVSLYTDDGNAIYYTLDGSDPDASDGQLYTEPLTLTAGTTTVKAISVNQYQQSSLVAEATYSVVYDRPSAISIAPESGQFTAETYITIDLPNGSHAYYTWDGTNPTTASTVYSGPIQVIEGNNILSVIVVNSRGMQSDVFRYNYSYTPDDN